MCSPKRSFVCDMAAISWIGIVAGLAVTVRCAGADSKRVTPPAEQTAAIQAVREYALSYRKTLPNYTCTLRTREITNSSSTNPIPLRKATIEEQLSFIAGKEIRRVTNASAQAPDQTAGMMRGEYGNLLEIIFNPASGAEIRWDRSITLNHRTVLVLDYRVPQARGYVLADSWHRTVQVPFEGSIYADPQSHAIVRIHVKCVKLPDNIEYQEVELTLDYKAVSVAGREFVLPSHFEMFYRTGSVRQANSGDYFNYRRFASDASVTFQDEAR